MERIVAAVHIGMPSVAQEKIIPCAALNDERRFGRSAECTFPRMDKNYPTVFPMQQILTCTGRNNVIAAFRSRICRISKSSGLLHRNRR